MNAFLQRPERGPGLKFFMGHSIFLHLFIVAIFFGLTKYLNISMEEKIKANLVLVESSVKIDVVAMPKLTVKELRNIKPIDLGGSKDSAVNEPPKVESKNTSDVTFEKKGKKPLSFMERMKLLSKKQAKKEKKVKNKTKTRASNNSGIDKQARNDLKDLVLAGNKLSKGNSVVGVGAGGVSGPFVQYLQRLPDHIRPHWKLPSYLLNQNLQCRIRVYLGASGKLLKAEVFQSSGVKEYDNKALEAVKKSSPFPSLAREFRIKGTNGDIVLGFPL